MFLNFENDDFRWWILWRQRLPRKIFNVSPNELTLMQIWWSGNIGDHNWWSGEPGYCIELEPYYVWPTTRRRWRRMRFFDCLSFVAFANFDSMLVWLDDEGTASSLEVTGCAGAEVDAGVTGTSTIVYLNLSDGVSVPDGSVAGKMTTKLCDTLAKPEALASTKVSMASGNHLWRRVF